MMIKRVLETFVIKNRFTAVTAGRAQFSQKKKQEDSEEEREGRNAEAEQQNQDVTKKQNRKTLAWTLWRILFWTSATVYGHQLYTVFTHDKKTPIQKSATTIPIFIDAAKYTENKYHQTIDFFTKPPVKKFLPDPLHPSLPQKTLVLNLSGTVVHTNFVFGKGIEYKLRPGLQNLLSKFRQNFEIIIFTDDDYMFVMNAIPHIDPKQEAIRAAFGRQSMVWSSGNYIKDLTYLNRDMRNVIVIDKSLDKLKGFKRNTIILSQFKGNQEDKQLFDLSGLLTQLAKPEVRDVRIKLQNYGPEPLKTYKQLMDKKIKKIEEKKQGYNKIFGLFGRK